MRFKLNPIVSILIALSLFACGQNAQLKRNSSLIVALTTVDAARDSFIAWDREHQETIVKNATSKEDAEAKLTAYRKKQAEISSLFKSAYDTMKAAAEINNDQSMKAMLDVVMQLSKVLDDLKKAGV